MFKAKQAKQTLIAAGCRIRGDISAKGSLHIDGSVEGRVEVDGDVSVGPDGRVVGGLIGGAVTVAGRVEGAVVVEGHLVIAATGVVTQDVRYGTLEVHRGGKLLGRAVAIGDAESELAADKEDAPGASVSVLPKAVGQA